MRHGRDAEPVIVIDDFAPAPERFIDDAGCLRLAPIGDHYPGIRALMPPRLVDPLLVPLASMIRETFGLDRCRIEEAYYSLITTSPATLRPIQRLPHFDGVEPEKLALLHYLARDERGGTAFYRHRGTGFETITATRLPEYRRALATISRAKACLNPPSSRPILCCSRASAITAPCSTARSSIGGIRSIAPTFRPTRR